MARIAVDVCIGRVGIKSMRDAGHDVVVVARAGETDRNWFDRALIARAEVVISADTDLEILCYDHCVEFFKARTGQSGRVTAERFIQRHARRATR